MNCSCMRTRDEINCEHDDCLLRAGIVVPLRVRKRPVGSLKFYYTTPRLLNETQLAMAEGLAQFLSTQLELSELDHQTALACRMELKALQAQINPHFLFNTINTIASLIRTDPPQARDLLREFAAFYRSTLEMSEDLDHARAGDRLRARLLPLRGGALRRPRPPARRRAPVAPRSAPARLRPAAARRELDPARHARGRAPAHRADLELRAADSRASASPTTASAWARRTWGASSNRGSARAAASPSRTCTSASAATSGPAPASPRPARPAPGRRVTLVIVGPSRPERQPRERRARSWRRRAEEDHAHDISTRC